MDGELKLTETHLHFQGQKAYISLIPRENQLIFSHSTHGDELSFGKYLLAHSFIPYPFMTWLLSWNSKGKGFSLSER